MKNELLQLGPVTIYGYGLMIALGILSAYVLACCRAGKKNVNMDHVFSLILWCLAGGFIGSKILFWITEWKNVVANPVFLRYTLMDGFVDYGGILGGIAAGYGYCRWKKLNFLEYFDFLMPSVALAQGFGRIGCLLAGCCYGKETESVLAIVFHSSDYAPNGIPLIPVQIYSSLLDFLNMAVLLWASSRKKKDGQVAGLYLLLYSLGRFLLEFLRGDLERGNVGSLSTSQFISLFTAAAGALLIFRKNRMQRHE